jgi:cytochrome c553
MSTLSTLKYCLGLTVAASVLTGCFLEVGIPADGDRKWGELNPIRGMFDNPAPRDQRAQMTFRDDQPEGMRYTPPRTVTVDGILRPDMPTQEESYRLSNPVPLTRANLEYGRFAFNTNCAVCHGIDGAGQGTIVVAGAYAPPPTLLSDRLRGVPDGHIYHVITYGQGQMWSYKNQLTDLERWSVVNYIRALQRADFPEPADLERARRQ